MVGRDRVVRTCSREVKGLWLLCTNALSFRGRLMSTIEIWGVNGHPTRCPSPVSKSRGFSWCPAESYRKCRSAPPYGPMRLGNDFTFYPRDAMLARVIAIATCPSVRLSVTRRYCVKTKKVSGMISSPSGSPKTLVF